MKDIVVQRISDSIEIKKNLLNNEFLLSNVIKLSDNIANAIKDGHKIVVCGNGGSASDALHFAGEILGRFQKERTPWPAITLNADVATLTAIANDYGYDNVFARQAEGLLNKGDLLIGISTSGNSENVCRAIDVAKKNRVKTAAFLGKDGGRVALQVDFPIIVPSMITARIQECHILLIHIICEIVESKLA